MIQEILNRIIQQHEDLVIQILREILHREPIPEDAKDICFIATEGIDDKKDVSYKGEKIGTIVYCYDFVNYKAGMTFYPCLELKDINNPQPFKYGIR